MEIIGQSTIIHKPNYFHLAYAAATTWGPLGGTCNTGLIIFVTGCILSLKVTKSITNWGLPSFNLRLKTNNTKFTRLGKMCVWGGSILILISIIFGQSKYDRPDLVTKFRMNSIISRSFTDSNSISEKIVTFPNSENWQVIDVNTQDGWFNPMKLEKITEDGQVKYFIISAGKDEKFNTNDDIKSEPIIAQK
jgi:hypothetical protein